MGRRANGAASLFDDDDDEPLSAPPAARQARARPTSEASDDDDDEDEDDDETDESVTDSGSDAVAMGETVAPAVAPVVNARPMGRPRGLFDDDDDELFNAPPAAPPAHARPASETRGDEDGTEESGADAVAVRTTVFPTVAPVVTARPMGRPMCYTMGRPRGIFDDEDDGGPTFREPRSALFADIDDDDDDDSTTETTSTTSTTSTSTMTSTTSDSSMHSYRARGEAKPEHSGLHRHRAVIQLLQQSLSAVAPSTAEAWGPLRAGVVQSLRGLVKSSGGGAGIRGADRFALEELKATAERSDPRLEGLDARDYPGHLDVAVVACVSAFATFSASHHTESAAPLPLVVWPMIAHAASLNPVLDAVQNDVNELQRFGAHTQRAHPTLLKIAIATMASGVPRFRVDALRYFAARTYHFAGIPKDTKSIEMFLFGVEVCVRSEHAGREQSSREALRLLSRYLNRGLLTSCDEALRALVPHVVEMLLADTMPFSNGIEPYAFRCLRRLVRGQSDALQTLQPFVAAAVNPSIPLHRRVHFASAVSACAAQLPDTIVLSFVNELLQLEQPDRAHPLQQDSTSAEAAELVQALISAPWSCAPPGAEDLARLFLPPQPLLGNVQHAKAELAQRLLRAVPKDAPLSDATFVAIAEHCAVQRETTLTHGLMMILWDNTAGHFEAARCFVKLAISSAPKFAWTRRPRCALSVLQSLARLAPAIAADDVALQSAVDSALQYATEAVRPSDRFDSFNHDAIRRVVIRAKRMVKVHRPHLLRRCAKAFKTFSTTEKATRDAARAASEALLSDPVVPSLPRTHGKK